MSQVCRCLRNGFDADGVLFGTGVFFMRRWVVGKMGSPQRSCGRVFFLSLVVHGMEEGVSVVHSVWSLLSRSVVFRC